MAAAGTKREKRRQKNGNSRSRCGGGHAVVHIPGSVPIPGCSPPRGRGGLAVMRARLAGKRNGRRWAESLYQALAQANGTCHKHHKLLHFKMAAHLSKRQVSEASVHIHYNPKAGLTHIQGTPQSPLGVPFVAQNFLVPGQISLFGRHFSRV